ncbi:MAG TPA: hypothetical protein DCY20_09580 [Firmicutes bacterium]|nr:hypothetical protein [Bacillota bacterium]
MECLPFTEEQVVMALSQLEVLLSQTYDEIECQRIINKIKWLGYELFKIETKKQESKFLGKMIDDQINKISQDSNQKNEAYLIPVHPIHQNAVNLHKNQVFSMEQLLKYYNGLNGNPLYIAIEGLVFDVTDLPNWEEELIEDHGADIHLPNGLQLLESKKVKQLMKHARLVGLII